MGSPGIGSAKRHPSCVKPGIGKGSDDHCEGSLFVLPVFVLRNRAGSGNNAADILQEDELRSAIGCDAEEVEEKARPSAFAKACPLPGEAEVLTGKASNHGVNSSAELITIQGSDVVPDGGGVEVPVAHSGLKDGLSSRVELTP